MADITNKKHLFFDLDDTLWDFQKNSGVVLRELFHEFELQGKLNADVDNFLDAYRGINLQFWSRYYKKEIDKTYLRNNRFNECFKLFNYENYEENLEITELYLQRAPKGTFLKEGCIDVLNYLKGNYKLHIITNGFKEIQAIKLDGCGLRNYFSHIIISEEHQLVKPDERIFRLAESLAGVSATDCVMIGDSYESDIAGAINAGWEAIYFTEDKPVNFGGRMITRLEELKEMF
jgi:putative hydrolase of the HAD superfamily